MSHQERISGAVAGETSSTSIRFLVTNLITFKFTLFSICLSFSSPPLHKKFVILFAPFFICLFLVRSFVCVFSCLLSLVMLPSLLQDGPNATLRSETLWRNCVRCHNHKRWCKITDKKRCKTFAMEGASNMVQILVVCAMQGIRSSSINYLRWGGTKETGSQMKVCALYSIQFTRMNCLWLVNTKETVSQIKVCAIYGMRFTRMNCSRWDKRIETIQYIKMCVIRGKQVCNQKCVWRPIITQTVAANKTCVLCGGIAYRTTTYIYTHL